MLHRKLSSFLKTFAAVNGMPQLYRHTLLLSIFTSLLSNPDVSLAQLSLACVIKFKLPHVTPYAPSLRVLLERSELLVCHYNGNNNDNGNEGRNTKMVTTMERLCRLLLPFLRFDRKIPESGQSDVLGILHSILPRIRTSAATLHFHALSRLLGPNGSGPGTSSLDVRQKIVDCLGAIADHGVKVTALGPVVEALRGLCASNERHVDDWDFDKVLPILNGFGSVEGGENG